MYYLISLEGDSTSLPFNRVLVSFAFNRVVESLDSIILSFYIYDSTCAICFDVDASVPRRVITKCAHIYHELCLKNHYLAFLKHKTCFSCPLCHAIIN